MEIHGQSIGVSSQPYVHLGYISAQPPTDPKMLGTLWFLVAIVGAVISIMVVRRVVDRLADSLPPLWVRKTAAAALVAVLIVGLATVGVLMLRGR